MLQSGFEPESQAREARMIGRTTLLEHVKNNLLLEQYYYISKYEIYVGPSQIDLKGISDTKLQYHRDYMLDFMFRFLKLVEVGSRKQIITNLVQFANYYKRRELEVGYYRELNSDSLFRLNKEFIGDIIGIQQVDSVDDIDISFNYMKFTVPFIKLLI